MTRFFACLLKIAKTVDSCNPSAEHGSVELNHQRIEPGPGQESVWDYPRLSRLDETAQHVKAVFNGEVIADTR